MYNKRIITIGAFLILAWIGMMAKVMHVQLIKNSYYTNMAERQSMRRTIIAPERGEIFDRKGRVLVQNAQVELSFSDGKKEKQRELNRVAPYGKLAGQVLGNISKDGYGQMGLEYDQDKVLRGVDGWKYARYDVKRHYYPGVDEQSKESMNGQSLVTTIDVDIQKITEQALERGVERTKSQRGVAIVVDPFTGDVLSMANYPFYNPNRRTKADLKGWKNMAISKLYEPGSTFKIITSAAVFEEGKVNPSDIFYGEKGRWQYNGALVHDTKPHEKFSFKEAMAYSSNIAMAKSALMLKPSVHYKYIRSFGFGMKTGIELPAEEGGTLRPVDEWSSRTQITLAWGQEINATPLQVTMAVAAVANGGMLMKPRLIKEIKDEKGNVIKEIPSKKVRRVVSPETTEKLKEIMTAVVEFGTAKNLKSERYSIAGKTGTAEKIDPKTGTYMKGHFHSSFVGMVPVENPKYVCLVLMDDPQLDKYGGSSAGPVFKEIMDRLVSTPSSDLIVEKPTTIDSRDNKHAKNEKKVSIHMASFGGNGEEEGQLLNQRKVSPAKHELEDFQTQSMPDLRNLSLRDAIIRLKDFEVEVNYSGIGNVVTQSPAPNSKVSRGIKCTLKLGQSS